MNALHSLFSLWSFLSFISEAPESAAHCWNVAPFNFSSWYYQSYDSWGWHHISAVCVLYLLRHQLTLARAALSISICFFFSALKLSAKSSSHFKHFYLSKHDFLAFSLFLSSIFPAIIASLSVFSNLWLVQIFQSRSNHFCSWNLKAYSFPSFSMINSGSMRIRSENDSPFLLQFV